MTDPLTLMLFKAKRKTKELEDVVKEGEKMNVYGSPADEPILGTNLKLPASETVQINPTLDTSLPYVRLYKVEIY